MSPPWLPNCLLTPAGGNIPFECVCVSGPKPGTFSPLCQQILIFLYEIQHLKGLHSPPHLFLRGGSQRCLCTMWPCSFGHQCLAPMTPGPSLVNHILCPVNLDWNREALISTCCHWEDGEVIVLTVCLEKPTQREAGWKGWRETHTEYELGHEMSRDLWPRVMTRASTVPDDFLFSSSKSPWGFVLFPALGYHNPPSHLITPFCFFFWFTVILLLLVTSKRVLIRLLDFRTPFYKDRN